MGNVVEDWMSEIEHDENSRNEMDSDFVQYKQASSFIFSLKNGIFPKFLFNDSISKFFYNWKKLPKSMVNNYNNIIPK